MTAADIGARIVSFDSEARVKRIEEAGRRFSAEVGLVLEMGARPDAILLDAMVERMAGLLFEVISKPALGADASALLRLDPLRNERKPEAITFLGRRVRIYLRARERGFRRSGPALAPRDPCAKSRLGDRASSLRTKASARP